MGEVTDSDTGAVDAAGEREADDGPRRIKSVEVGFRTIKVLEAAGGFLPLARIAALAGMPSSKAYIYLASFMREGLVQQDPRTGHYGLGPFSVQLGLAAIRNLDVVSISRDLVDGLRDQTTCGVTLAIWGSRGPSVVLKADGEGQGALSLRVGHVFWPTTSASGRVFLAYLPGPETAEAVRLEQRLRGNASVSAPRALLEQVRKDGYAMSDRPAVSGRMVIAAPAFDFSGRVVAAVAILTDDPSPDGPARAALLACVEEMSRRLGYRADRNGSGQLGG